jgi:hypothetical protein
MGIRPVVGDEASIPTEDRVGSDEEDRPAVTAEHASERGEDRTVLGVEARTRDQAPQHRRHHATMAQPRLDGATPGTARVDARVLLVNR